MLPIAWWVLMASGFALWGAFIVIARTRVAAVPSTPNLGPFAAQASKLDPPVMAEVRALTPYIRAVLRSRGVLQRDEWDVVQDVLIGAWKAITSGRYRPSPTASLKAWVAEIARRQAATYRRSVRHRWEELTDPGEIHHESRRARPDEMLEDAEDAQFVAEHLKCPDEKQSVLLAHDLDGLAIAEIARDRRVPLSTAYRWRASALASLQDEARQRSQAPPAGLGRSSKTGPVLLNTGPGFARSR
jgi:RNA polymerase sigma factor (sigma-70 family)